MTAPTVVTPAEPGWHLAPLPGGGIILRPEAWDGLLWPQVGVQLLSLPSPLTVAGYCETYVELLDETIDGAVLELTPSEAPPAVRVLLTHSADTTAVTTLQRHQLLSERMVLLASASCAVCDWPALEPTLERLVASCHLEGDVPDPGPAGGLASPESISSEPTTTPALPGELRAHRFDVSADLLDRLAQDVVDARTRPPDERLRTELAAAGLGEVDVPDAAVVAAALVRSDAAGRFTLVSAGTSGGRMLEGWVSELGVTTLERSETVSQQAAATFSPTVGSLPSVVADALGLRAWRVDGPGPAADDMTWDELLAPFWSPGEAGWLSAAEADGIVLHHLVWSRADADPADALVLVALDAGDRGWLTAVPDPATGRYTVRQSSTAELWRALCGLLGDLARVPSSLR